MNKNKNGFTMVELLAVIIVLGIVVGIALIFSRGTTDKSKKNAEEIFTNNLKDAVEIYLDSERYNLVNGGVSWNHVCSVQMGGVEREFNKLSENKSFDDIINSSYAPISREDVINPINKDSSCDVDENNISIFKDNLLNQYYYFTLDCLEYIDYVTNLPIDMLEECNLESNYNTNVYISQRTNSSGKKMYACNNSGGNYVYTQYQLGYYDKTTNQDVWEDITDHKLWTSVAGEKNIRCRARIDSNHDWVYSENSFNEE